jgi:hypothetical protein
MPDWPTLPVMPANKMALSHWRWPLCNGLVTFICNWIAKFIINLTMSLVRYAVRLARHKTKRIAVFMLQLCYKNLSKEGVVLANLS